MKRLTVFLLLLAAGLNSYAFDWKPQTNEALRADMFSFVEKFRDGTADRKLADALEGFLKE